MIQFSDNFVVSIIILNFFLWMFGVLVIMWGMEKDENKIIGIGIVINSITIAIISALLQY